VDLTDKVAYTAKAHTAGRSAGTNPEQLFAAGWSACFEGAIGIAARRMQIALRTGTAIDAEVDLCNTRGAFYLHARLAVSPGLEHQLAQAIVDAAHQTCPYSKATRGNVDVAMNVVTSQPVNQIQEIHQ
jgi:osmotically inducible protein OsmC